MSRNLTWNYKLKMHINVIINYLHYFKYFRNLILNNKSKS